MKYPRHCSASGMFVFNNVPSFKELWRKSIYGFKQRVDNSLNKVVNTVANTTLLSSRLSGEQFFIVYRRHSPDAHVGVNVQTITYLVDCCMQKKHSTTTIRSDTLDYELLLTSIDINDTIVRDAFAIYDNNILTQADNDNN